MLSPGSAVTGGKKTARESALLRSAKRFIVPAVSPGRYPGGAVRIYSHSRHYSRVRLRKNEKYSGELIAKSALIATGIDDLANTTGYEYRTAIRLISFLFLREFST